MKRKDNSIVIIGVSALLMNLTFASCSTEELGSVTDPMNGPPTIEAIDAGSQNVKNVTRALNSKLEQFSLYVVDEYYDEEGAIADNILQSNKTGSWKSAETYYFMDDPQNAYGIAPTADLEGMSAVVNYDTQNFTYTVPTTEQSMVKIASRLDFTKQSISNNLKMTFRDALFSLEVQAVNEIKDVKIFVKSVTFHNVIPTGTFTFDKKKESRGKWSVNVNNRSICVDYEQVLGTAKELSRTNYLPIVDSTFTLMPQDLYDNLWYPYDCEWAEEDMVESFADAKTNKHMYIEVKCQIIQEKDGETLYLWGYAPDNDEGKDPFESVFFPYDE